LNAENHNGVIDSSGVNIIYYMQLISICITSAFNLYVRYISCKCIS